MCKSGDVDDWASVDRVTNTRMHAKLRVKDSEERVGSSALRACMRRFVLLRAKNLIFFEENRELALRWSEEGERERVRARSDRRAYIHF